MVIDDMEAMIATTVAAIDINATATTTIAMIIGTTVVTPDIGHSTVRTTDTAGTIIAIARS